MIFWSQIARGSNQISGIGSMFARIAKYTSTSTLEIVIPIVFTIATSVDLSFNVDLNG